MFKILGSRLLGRGVLGTSRIYTTARLLTGAFIASAALMGCSEETVSSTNIKTAGIAGLFEVTAGNATSSTAKATLVVGGDESNTYVNLDNGDKLIASAGTESKTMNSGDGAGRYEANFATGAGGTEFTIVLERPDDTNAPGNTGILPAPFEITEVPSTTPSRKTDAITIKWDNAAASKMEIEIDGDCVFKSTFTAPSGTSEYTIDAGEIDSTGVKPEDEKTCDLKVKMTRMSTGSTDSALDKESRFRLYQTRSTSFASAP